MPEDLENDATASGRQPPARRARIPTQYAEGDARLQDSPHCLAGSSGHRFPWRGVLLRGAAVLLGLSPLLLCELGLRIAGWERADEIRDPYVGFTALHPLFSLDRASQQYRIPAHRLALFCAESFGAVKGAGERRVFCLGGSAVQGRPYAIETAFSRWLELSLQAADPRHAWRVVNCGGVSYASYRLVPIVREVLRYQPDLLIVYTGHNEFLEDRTYHHIRRTPQALVTLQGAMSHLRTYQACRTVWRGRRPLLAPDARARLDYRDGLTGYHRDDPWQRSTIAHFRNSLQRMLRLAREADVPLILCDPVADLKDTAPFKVEPSTDLSRSDRRQFASLCRRAAGAGIEPSARADILAAAVALDPRHAGAWYDLGRAWLDAGLPVLAEQALTMAKDEDVCPLRMLEPMHAVLRQVAAEGNVPLVEVRENFARTSFQGIPGREWLVDHVHPTIAGHQFIANLLLEAIAAQGLVRLAPGWISRRDALYQAQCDALPADYFPRAAERLRGLRRWTEGRAYQVPDPTAASR
jgi:hypothetical protein